MGYYFPTIKEIIDIFLFFQLVSYNLLFSGLLQKLLQKLGQVQDASAQLLLHKGAREVAKPPSVRCIACQFDKRIQDQILILCHQTMALSPNHG